MRQRGLANKPFVSILVASYNESNVIGRLMKSFTELTYGHENFEVIVVDDSNDGTSDRLQKWQDDIPNMKILHRNSREGWKGGALNLAIQEMDRTSAYALVVDADHVPEKDLLEKGVQCFASYNNLVAVQGFPIPSIGAQNSWVSRGICFRLARRNLIEFVAKEKLELPIQITGSLFMIRADVLRRIRFSHDLTEDWELTLALHLQDHGLNYKRILFHPSLVSYCEAPSRLYTYFRQRSRISEGHTRGFKKRLSNILRGPLSIKEKLELFFTGMQYAKFLLILALLVVTCARLFTDDIVPIGSTLLFVTSLVIQAVALSIYVGHNVLSIHMLGSQNFSYKDILFLVALNVCTFSAFVVGSLRGLLRQNGVFYKTERSNQ
jgi:cellulose synthase/poly-beta-1,6-N-acetylglucosamine synthase-like glycosyltransferase